MKRKPISKPFTFQVEKYVGTERFLDPLALGTELILPVILYVYRHQARQGVDKNAAAPAYPARMYIFTGCTVISKEYGELNAEQSSILTETTTIAYRELIAITNPFQGSSEKEEWTFKDNKEADGTYKNKYAAVSPGDNKDAAYPFSKNKDGQWERNDADLYDFATDGEIVKRAAESKVDLAGGVYQYEPGKVGKRSMTRIDDTDPLLNKPAWDGSNGAEIKWAKTNEAKDPQPQMYPDVKRARENTGPTTAPVTYPPTERAKSNKGPLPTPALYPGTQRAKINTGPVPEPKTYPPTESAKSNKGPLPTPVTWPPTRRALMAENLKR